MLHICQEKQFTASERGNHDCMRTNVRDYRVTRSAINELHEEKSDNEP